MGFAVQQGDEWHFSWQHSVHKSLVEEHFRVLGENQLELFFTRYKTYGVGLPFLPEEGKLVQKDGFLELTMKRDFAEVNIATGLEASLELHYRGKIIKLYEEYPPGAFLNISVQKRYKVWQ